MGNFLSNIHHIPDVWMKETWTNKRVIANTTEVLRLSI
jgi:hypothetical protein